VGSTVGGTAVGAAVAGAAVAGAVVAAGGVCAPQPERIKLKRVTTVKTKNMDFRISTFSFYGSMVIFYVHDQSKKRSNGLKQAINSSFLRLQDLPGNIKKVARKQGTTLPDEMYR
jgi:hypothetical protein